MQSVLHGRSQWSSTKHLFVADSFVNVCEKNCGYSEKVKKEQLWCKIVKKKWNLSLGFNKCSCIVKLDIHNI